MSSIRPINQAEKAAVADLFVADARSLRRVIASPAWLLTRLPEFKATTFAR